MTSAEAAISSVGAGGSRPSAKNVVACGFCRRRLADEYYFTCRRCEASYCYIHMSRHQPSLCARQSGRRRLPRAPASPMLQRDDVPLGGGGQLLLAGARQRPVPSVACSLIQSHTFV